ncbi:excinuclease ABC subunit B [bacterium (Candidatus Torokbacteria) CG_4_10_14_0_2_um_filter_35_8]|nr:MAG: excinuclease ABC subunit B [bacterium (Candidatus Torokbacteria) CG_4_10_14_0_2_um_filter_35_8]
MPKFEIESKFKPTGDQPQAIKKLTKGIQTGKKHQTLLGVTGSGKTFTIANVIQNVQRPTLVLAHNKTLAAQLAQEFSDFFPVNAVQYFVSYYDYYQPESYIPRTDTYIEKDADINEEIEKLRNKATEALLTRSDVIIVASVSCIYGLGSPEDYEDLSIEIRKEKEIEREKVLRRLTEAQYQRNNTELGRGTFRVRGDSLQIHPAYQDNIVQISFFGDKIEKIAMIDSLTGEIKEDLEKVKIYPARHWVTPQDVIKRAIKSIEEELRQQVKFFKKQGKLLEAQRIAQRTNFDIEMLLETGYCTGIENYTRHLSGTKPGDPPAVLLDYYPKDFLMVIDESHISVPQVQGMYWGNYSRKKNLVDYGFRLSSAFDNRPLSFEEFENHINQVIYTSATPSKYELTKCGVKNTKKAFTEKNNDVVQQLIRPTGLLDPDIEIRKTKGQIDHLLSEIHKRVRKGQRVLVTTLTKKMAEDLAEYLAESGIKVHYLHSEIDTLERLEILRDLRLGKYDVVVGINLLREGLDLPEVSLVAILDSDKEGFLRSETSLIQVMGRAARHIEGHVIMYADNITGSMRKAISETKRRRETQEEYNKEHNITPQSIKKKIAKTRLAGKKAKKKGYFEIEDLKKKIPAEEIPKVIKILETKMELAAKNLEFEKAAEFRNQIRILRGKAKNK